MKVAREATPKHDQPNYDKVQGVFGAIDRLYFTGCFFNIRQNTIVKFLGLLSSIYFILSDLSYISECVFISNF